jgi:hypothetical protein
MLTNKELVARAEPRKGPCVSIYLPMLKTGEVEQNAIRFKNAMQHARHDLEAMGERQPAIDSMLKPALELIDEERFWSYQEPGLAAFIAQDVFEPLQVPVTVEEQVIVSDRFHIAPLVPLVEDRHPYFVLTVTQAKPRLFRVTATQRQVIEPEDMPEGIDDVLKYDDPERSLQHHSGSGGKSAQRSAVFHGQGVGSDDAKHKKDILRYFQSVDRSVGKVLKGENNPLLLIGLDWLVGLYREANSYPHVMEDEITVDPETLSDNEIHLRSLEIIRPIWEADLTEAKENYIRYRETQKTSNDPDTLMEAAVANRIGTLFVARGEHKWGRVRSDAVTLDHHDTYHPGDVDILDVIAATTLARQGQVFRMDRQDLPDENSIAAVFRF